MAISLQMKKFNVETAFSLPPEDTPLKHVEKSLFGLAVSSHYTGPLLREPE